MALPPLQDHPAAHLARPRSQPGREAVLLGALIIGLLMLGLQLWLLSVALELYLGGEGEGIWGLAIVSGVLFLGGLLATRLLSRQTVVRRTAGGAADDRR